MAQNFDEFLLWLKKGAEPSYATALHLSARNTPSLSELFGGNVPRSA
ncbi:hypothetical protein L4D06_17630 [Enterovibrio makurazakiensis]|uniref:Uncharacterized protein n=1 Tax=Enterovibrio gelatinilyticus TaxID=2899819 RepID=A0ABT5R729_9GAMM|nr:hypothetical protein [Enterovibrio sp. ZSDZ42]MDD1796087.1 hypothetical protein [Enterovibrio sp. ZSDZ42]